MTRNALFPVMILALTVGCSNKGDDDDSASTEADAGVKWDAGVRPDAGTTVRTCWSCHGTEAQPAPPPDLSGSTDPTQPGVGSHAAHMRASTTHNQVKCVHCHKVPTTVEETGHVDDQRPADITFFGLASATRPATMSNGTCATYCHGDGMRFDRRTSPPWTSTTSMTCTSCHGMPPRAPHPAAQNCGHCHGEVANEQGQILVVKQHIDGVLMAPHGAHLVHLGGAGGQTFSCDTCHPGGNVHGPLKDGQPLETSTFCTDCHAAGTVQPLEWRTYQPPSQ